MEKNIFYKALRTRWKILKALFVRIFGDDRNKQIADSELRSLRRVKKLENYSLLPKTTRGLKEAKQIFYDYNCLEVWMIREGVYERFKELGGTYELQVKWRKEYIKYWTNKLSTENITPVDKLQRANAIEALPYLTEMADKGDGYARLWFAIAIQELLQLDNSDISAEIRKTGEKTVKSILMTLSNNPTGNISEEHKKKITPYLQMFHASTPEEYVTNRARLQLGKYANSE